MIVEHAIYKYFKNRKERKNSPAQSNNKEKGDVKENFGIMDAGLISDTQVYSLFTEYTTIIKIVVGVLMALVAYLFNRDCENMLILLFVILFAFFFSITYILLFIIFNIFGFRNICYYDPYSKREKVI